MNRRAFLSSLALMALGLNGCRYWPRDGLSNPCLKGDLPGAITQNALFSQIWQGLALDKVWDCHVHLIGVGDSDSGVWLNPNMQSLLHPIQYTQFRFYMNAACARVYSGSVDKGMVQRLLDLHREFPAGVRFMLLAFDYAYNRGGQRLMDKSVFHTPNDYARRVAQRYPQQFEWIASIHPYREDCVEALDSAVAQGARAIKWLPGAMNIDPSDPLCDRFYAQMVKHGLPLLVHSGSEHAVHVGMGQRLNNPLLMRRALEQGVRVIFAHCASLGRGIDLDKGADGPEVDNFTLFARLMDQPDYANRMYGDIAAITQVNYTRDILEKIVQYEHWHERLLYGSDYPLPGIIPLVSLAGFVQWGYITQDEAEFLTQLRKYNPIMFDLALKRFLKVGTHQLQNKVFESLRVFIG